MASNDNGDTFDTGICIIGLGLIGGSLARAFREKLDIRRISAVDTSEQQLDRALHDGIIGTAVPMAPDTQAASSHSAFCKAVQDADFIFICTPHNASVKYLRMLRGKVRPGCVVTDTGSTKLDMMRHAAALNYLDGCFIGGHPMAGSEKSGYSESYAHLFENAYFILTPPSAPDFTPDSIAPSLHQQQLSQQKMQALESLLSGIGAISIIMDAEAHDRAMAAISHLPHVIASTLVNLVHDHDNDNEIADGVLRMLAAGGFKDITRIASSEPRLWQGITSSNKDFIAEMLDSFICVLRRFKDDLIADDAKAVEDFFRSARTYRDAIPAGQGAIGPSCEIIANVADRPGIIGEIATLLGKWNINIKNLRIDNSRENENGCLRLTLSDIESVRPAIDLLTKYGYKVSN